MTTMTFDRLAYIDRLKAVGFTEPQARGMADGLDQALREEVATKSDIASVRGEIAGVRSEIALLRSDLSSEIASARSDLRTETALLKVDLLKWVVMLVAGQTAVFTALKLLGH